MSVDHAQSLISELEDAIQSGPGDRRAETLRRVTDLFMTGVERFGPEQIALFDSVMGRLIDRIETQALIELSECMAPIDLAPPRLMRRLAANDEIRVAQPVLEESIILAGADLVELAKTKSQAHLLAISGRKQLDSSVTDVLVDRGDRRVVHKTVNNAGASFTEQGFDSLVERSSSDDELQ